MFHRVLLSKKRNSSTLKEHKILTDDSCSSICKSLSRSLLLNAARLAVLIDGPLDGIGTSSNIGRLARFGYPADIAVAVSVVRLFVKVLAAETEGFSG
jgi:hypothetical protein